MTTIEKYKEFIMKIYSLLLIPISLVLLISCGTLEINVESDDSAAQTPTNDYSIVLPTELTRTPYADPKATPTPFEVMPDSVFAMELYENRDWEYRMLVPVGARENISRGGQLVTFTIQDPARFIGSYMHEVEIIPSLSAAYGDTTLQITTANELIKRQVSELAGVSETQMTSPEGSDYTGAMLSYPVSGVNCPEGRAVLIGYIVGDTGYLLRIRSDIVGHCDVEHLPETPYVISEFRITKPTTGSAPINADPLFGLVYREFGNGLWHINADGNAFQILTEQEGVDTAVVSPNGLKVLLRKADDIWIRDISSGEETNLTNTIDRVEADPLWWSAVPETIVFGSSTLEEMGPSYGYLSSVGIDGSGYLILDKDTGSFSSPALSPVDSTIAYDRAGSAWFYRLDAGFEAFDLGEIMIMDNPEEIKIASPAWSPDGSKLAWVIGGPFGEGESWRMGLVVFDLQHSSFDLLHLYEPIGGSGWPPAPVWSSDGSWLAFQTLSERNKSDLWAIRADGSEEYYLGFSSKPIWSPDGKFLVYSELPCDQTPCFSDTVNQIIEVGIWEAETLDLPPESLPHAWVEMP